MSITSQDNRKINTGLTFLSGMMVGAICYLIAETLVPEQVANPGDHDILLANRLGFIYTPVVGLWLGWLQKSWQRALIGGGVGVLLGLIYMDLCASRNFLAIMVGFPCLLGGVLAAVVGSNRSDWLRNFGARLGKGILTGLLFGFIYMVTLTIVGAMVMTNHDVMTNGTRNYISMMWRAGPAALGLASSLFFVLIRWAVGLTRVRIMLFEKTDTIMKDTH